MYKEFGYQAVDFETTGRWYIVDHRTISIQIVIKKRIMWLFNIKFIKWAYDYELIEVNICENSN